MSLIPQPKRNTTDTEVKKGGCTLSLLVMHFQIYFTKRTRRFQQIVILTATILFIASSFRESLLLSSISFKSSCLKKSKAKHHQCICIYHIHAEIWIHPAHRQASTNFFVLILGKTLAFGYDYRRTTCN